MEFIVNSPSQIFSRVAIDMERDSRVGLRVHLTGNGVRSPGGRLIRIEFFVIHAYSGPELRRIPSRSGQAPCRLLF